MAKSKKIEKNDELERRGLNKDTSNIRTEKEKADDLLLICQLRKQNIGWRTIAQRINSQRDYDLNFFVYYTQYHTAKSHIQKEALTNKDELIEAELSEIDWQIDELTKAWQRSIGVKQKTQTKTSGKIKLPGLDEDGEEDPMPLGGMFITEWEESGDPRYMAEITKLRERRAKLLGIDSPDKVEHSGEVKIPAFSWGKKPE